LGGTLSSDTVALGGIARACTWGRDSSNRWAGLGIGLLATFLTIGTTGMPWQRCLEQNRPSQVVHERRSLADMRLRSWRPTP